MGTYSNINKIILVDKQFRSSTTQKTNSPKDKQQEDSTEPGFKLQTYAHAEKLLAQ